MLHQTWRHGRTVEILDKIPGRIVSAIWEDSKVVGLRVRVDEGFLAVIPVEWAKVAIE